MAKIITLQLLLDTNDQRVTDDMFDEILAAYPMIIDHDIINDVPVCHELEDMIVNETYEAGDAFKSWVVYSPRTDDVNGDGCYYSETYGWSSYDLATRYAPTLGACAVDGDGNVVVMKCGR